MKSSEFSQILVETGHIGRQASAAVTVTDGETVSNRLKDKIVQFQLDSVISLSFPD